MNLTPYFFFIKYYIIEHFESSKWYRRFSGGVWYFVADIDSGTEYWTRTKYPIELGLTIKIEDYTNET